MICILHLQNFRYDYIRIFYRKNTTCQKIIGGAKPPPEPPTPYGTGRDSICAYVLQALIRFWLTPPIAYVLYGCPLR